MSCQHIQVPRAGDKIGVDADNVLRVPDNPIIPYIEGDGVGVDITPVMLNVVDHAVEKAYAGQRKVHWAEAYMGEKALEVYGEDEFMPTETLEFLRECLVGIKGPLTTPVGGGIRSMNFGFRKELDLHTTVEPVRWLRGAPCPILQPQNTDMVVFREITEDVLAGIEWEAGSAPAEKIIKFLKAELGVHRIQLDGHHGIGIKVITEEVTKRLVRKALRYCIDEKRRSLTLVHKGNVMKFTEGAFREWGYQVVAEEFGGELVDGGPWYTVRDDESGREVLIKDILADAMFQQILVRPDEYDVIATMNLNGGYLSSALAAQVGGIGTRATGSLGDRIALFEANHGAAPRYAGEDKVNPTSLLLAGEMMLRHLGWREAAQLITKGIERAMSEKMVTYDFARLMDGATQLKCSEFGSRVIEQM